MLTTLGGLKLNEFTYSKPLLVLAYTLLEGPTPRRQLAELIWPQARQPDSSLRVALHALREHYPTVLLGDELLRAEVDCDALQLLRARGQTALEAYAGPFLHGVNLRGVSEEFQEWVLTQRERLAQHVQLEVLAFAERCDPQLAANLAEQVYRLPGAPPAEAGLLRQVLALSVPGSSLEQSVRQELEELEPEDSPASSQPSAARLLGRAAEFDTVLAWAMQPGGGVLALCGPGGIGKSSLAREVLRELDRHGQATLLVDAEGVQSVSSLRARIAHQRAPQQPGADTWAGIRPLLSAGSVILLDGVDALAAQQDWLLEATAALPQVRWLLTGRHNPLSRRAASRSDAPEGHSLRLGGLDVPAIEADWTDLEANPAVQLFVREARRVRRDFAVTPENAALLGGLARRLQGHPLSLLLAASWLRVEALEAVYQRVVRQASTLHDVTGSQQRSLALVAEHSWALLSEAEQLALLRLSAFADFEPADAVALGVTDELLGALLDHSFLEAYRPGSERLRVYPALGSALATHANQHPELVAQARRDHAAHYLNWLTAQPVSAAAIADELDNLNLAVREALQQSALTPAALYHLMGYFDSQARVESGTDLFQDWLDLAEDLPASDDVRAAAHIACMWLACRADRLLDAQTLATQFMGSPLADNPHHRMRALNTLATVRQQQGQYQVGVELLETALKLAREVGDPVREAIYLENVLSNLIKLGEVERVETLLTIAQKIVDQVGWLHMKVNLLWIKLEVSEPDYESIIEHSAALLTEAEGQNDTSLKAQILLYKGMAQLKIGQTRQALRSSQEIIVLAQALELKEHVFNAFILQSKAFYQIGRTQKARQSAKAALHNALLQGSAVNLIEGILSVAEDVIRTQPNEIRSFLAKLIHDPRIARRQLIHAKRLLGSDEVTPSALGIEEVARRFLEML